MLVLTTTTALAAQEAGGRVLDSARVAVASPGAHVGVRAAGVSMRVTAHSSTSVIAVLREGRRTARGPADASSGVLVLTSHADSAFLELARQLDAPARLELTVPAGASLAIEGDNGGAVRVEGVGGPAEVSSSNGGVTVLDASGYALVATSNGNVEVRLTSVDADTPMSFITSNGNIDLTIPEDVRATVVVAPSLTVESEIPLTRTRAAGGEASGLVHLALNGGGATIRCYTNNGVVRLHRLDRAR